MDQTASSRKAESAKARFIRKKFFNIKEDSEIRNTNSLKLMRPQQHTATKPECFLKIVILPHQKLPSSMVVRY
jgi:hypothetical protein